jgi:hypothetical protein
MIVMKSIKPKRLSSSSFRMTMINKMRAVGKEIAVDFQATTKTWTHQPEFKQEMSLQGPGPVLMISTEDEIWKMLNAGTKPHPIFAGIYTGKSDKKVLAFPGVFVPKTTPGLIGSGPGGSSGDMVHTPYVNHPGTAPRLWDDAITAKWESRFKEQMQDAMSEWAKKSEHAI